MVEEKILRLVKWFNGSRAPPFTLDINPTDKCNLRCIHCWQRTFENIDSSYELPDEKLIEVVKEGIKLGVKEFEITGGGEPLMRKSIVLKIMKTIKKSGRFGNITTNGTLFTENDAKEIIKIGWDRITFSIDGPNERINDYLRGKDCFKGVVNSINIFNKLKKKFNKKFPQLKFNVVVWRKNYDKVCEIVELAKKLNCELIHFDSLTVHPPTGKKLKLNKRQMKEFENFAKEAKKLAESYGIWTDVDMLKWKFLENSNNMIEILKNEGNGKDFLSIPCYEPWWHLVIKTNGTAQPCCLYDEKEENVKNKTLKEIWFGEYFRRIRENIKNKVFSHYCSICNAGQVFENRRIRMELRKWMRK
jgi:MoaA/NifB/PqqE/SkfB family radical SAM enzyme